MPTKIVVNCTTGESEEIEMEGGELAAHEAMIAAEAERVANLPPVPDYGADGTKADKIADGVTQLRAYLALPSPTAAQSAAALKLVIRALLFLMRRTGL